MSDGPSTQNHRITKPDFRPCSTCRSRSQAPLCLYTLRAISGRAEGTFGRLRYSLGGDRPSQTARLTVFQYFLYRLELQSSKSGISPLTPQRLAPPLQSLPPMLHILNQSSVPGYSKGSRGLSVQVLEARIFTGTRISPSLLLRQWGGRFTIRAGRNLPDKEFRYLRTVIVTAAVYRGFNSELRPKSNPSS